MDRRGRLDEATLRRFVFQTFGRARRTQDSPVMPDVWLRYYASVAERSMWAEENDQPLPPHEEPPFERHLPRAPL